MKHGTKGRLVGKVIRIVGLLGVLAVLLGSHFARAQTTIVHMSANHGPEFYDYLRERAEVFQQLNPDIEVQIDVASTGYTEAVQVRIASGVQVDVLDSTHSFMVFASQDRLVDLRPYLEPDGVDIAGAIAPFALDVLGNDGAIFGIPSQIYNKAVIYNRTLFDEIGLPALQDLGDAWSWSWSWIRENSRRLTRNTSGDGTPDTYAVSFPVSFISIDSIIHQAGGMLYDRYLNPTESRFLSNEVREGLGFLVDLWQSDVARSVGVDAIYATRGAAINLDGVPNQLPWIRESIDAFEVVVQPRGPVRSGGQTYFGPYHVLKSNDERQQAAYRWLRFLALDVESQVKMMEATGRLPAYVPVLRDLQEHLVGRSDVERKFLTEYAHASLAIDNFPHYLTPAEAAIASQFNPGFRRVLEGEEPLESFLTTMHQLAQIELDR